MQLQNYNFSHLFKVPLIQRPLAGVQDTPSSFVQRF